LVVDQLEELFTLCLDTSQREAYARALAGAARDTQTPLRVVFTLRDDFLLRADGLTAFRNRLSMGIQLLTTPGHGDLLRIVTEPARRAGFEFDDPALPAEMVEEVSEQPGALALLSFTASQLWEARDRHFRRLLRGAYDAMGGVAGALAKHAENTVE